MSVEFEGHTPGPWEVMGAGPMNYPYAIRASHVPLDKPGAIRDITRWGAISMPSSSEGRANAALIAAAPSLLAENQRLRAQVAGLREALEHLEDAASCVAATFGHIREDYPERGAIFTHEGHTEAYLLDTINEARAALASAEDRT